MEDHARASDAMLATFITEQRDHNRLSNLRQDNIETLVIGPVVKGTTGAPVLNGDGLPMRDESKGLAARRLWRLGIIPTALQMVALTTAVLILLNSLG